MTLQNKIYITISLAALLIISIAIGSAVSHFRTNRLEKDVTTAKRNAYEIELQATESEQRAAQYKEKIEYLETQLEVIRAIARKQDEELEKLESSTRAARADVEHSRRVRSINTNAAELCAKLAELGYPCE